MKESPCPGSNAWFHVPRYFRAHVCWGGELEKDWDTSVGYHYQLKSLARNWSYSGGGRCRGFGASLMLSGKFPYFLPSLLFSVTI